MMTDSQRLLVEYAENGSQAAFRELVERYLDLVYSAAVRLMDGDAHLAEDVVQTVFTDLARRAHRISGEAMLGGWLHRHTCYVAAHLRRSERRRRNRERLAVEMNAFPDSSEANLSNIAPILDEAINQLRAKDRAAILMRFFEQQDFRSIGLALGSNEHAAQKRVSRALDKLHSILKRRGVAVSAGMLGSALAGKTVVAAPAGLAAHVSTAALTGAAGSGSALTLLKLMTMTKVKTAAVGSVVVMGVAASLIVQQQAHARMRDTETEMQRQSEQLHQMAASNQELSNRLAQIDGQPDELADLARMRSEIAALQARTNDLAALRVENRRLKATRPDGAPKTPLEIEEDKMARVVFAKQWLLTFRIYADDHNDIFPTNFAEAASMYDGPTNVSTNAFELVYQGSFTALTNPDDVIMLKEKEPSLDERGHWVKIYGMADGAVQTLGMPLRWTARGKKVTYDTFDAFEKDHIISHSGRGP